MKLAILAILMLSVFAQFQPQYEATPVLDSEWKDTILRTTFLVEGFIIGALGAPAEELTNCTIYSVDMAETLYTDVKNILNGTGFIVVASLNNLIWKTVEDVPKILANCHPKASIQGIIAAASKLIEGVGSIEEIQANILAQKTSMLNVISEIMVAFNNGQFVNAGSGIGTFVRKVIVTAKPDVAPTSFELGSAPSIASKISQRF